MSQAVSRRPVTTETRVGSQVGFVVDKVTVGQVFLRVLQVPLLLSIRHWYLYARCFYQKDKREKPGHLSETVLFLKSGRFG